MEKPDGFRWEFLSRIAMVSAVSVFACIGVVLVAKWGGVLAGVGAFVLISGLIDEEPG